MDIIKKQLQLFDFIQTKFNNKRSFISSINKLLPYQTSSLYKRLRGDASLTIQELVCLAKEYNLSLDAIFDLNVECIVFHNPSSSFDTKDPYLNYLNHLKSILTDINELPKVHLFHQVNELPIYYYLKYPELAFFKLFVYFNAEWKKPNSPFLKFDLKILKSNDQMKRIMKEIYTQYVKIPRREYWATNPYYYTIQQLISMLKDNMFLNKDDALVLFNLIMNLNQFLPEYIFRSLHRNIASLDLYISNIITNREILLIESESEKYVFKTLNSPILMRSKDLHLVNITKQWFERTEDLSICLTKGNRLKLPNFFNQQTLLLEQSKLQIIQMVEYQNNNVSL